MRLLITQQGIRVRWGHVVAYSDGGPPSAGQVVVWTTDRQSVPVAVGLRPGEPEQLLGALDDYDAGPDGVFHVGAWLGQLRSGEVYRTVEAPRPWSK